MERREASAPAGALPRPLTLSRKRARARGNGAEDGLRVSRRSASFYLRMILSENRTPLFGIMRAGSEPKRTSSGAWLRNRLYGWLCSCLPKHDRAEGRSHRRFRRDAMVLGGVVRRVVWHHSGAKRVARMNFFVLPREAGEGDHAGAWWRGPLKRSFVVVAEELLSPTPLPPPFGRSPLPAIAGRDEVEGAKRVARRGFFLPLPGGERSDCGAIRVRGIKLCRFARAVPPYPPRTFGARLPLPTGERERKRSEGEGASPRF